MKSSRSLLALVLVAVLSTTCADDEPDTPAAPTPNPAAPAGSVAGTWTGTWTHSTGELRMTMTLNQLGNAVTGSVNATEVATSIAGNGSLQGSVTGSTLDFQLAVPPGGFTAPMASCSMAMAGQATMSADGRTLTGTFTGHMSGTMMGGSSCGGPLNGGRFTLTR